MKFLTFRLLTALLIAFSFRAAMAAAGGRCETLFSGDGRGIEFNTEEREINWRLSESERESFIQNMAYMNMDKRRYPSDMFGEYTDWELLFFHGVTVRAAESPIYRELSQILLGRYSSLADLKQAMNSWSQRHDIGYQFAFFDDIERLGRQYQQQGLISVMEPIAQANGYIAEDLYAYLVKQRLYPLADPHDILSHLSSLTDPRFVKSFNRYEELISDVEGILGRNKDYWARAALKNSADPKQKAYGILWDHLYGTVRDSTHENWTYLVKGPSGDAELFTQGNASFNALLNGARKGDEKMFITEILNLAGYDPNMFGTDELRNFSGLVEYLKNPVSKAIYDRYEDILQKSLMDRGTYQIAEAKVRGFLDHGGYFKPRVENRRPTTEETRALLRGFTQFVATDPQLKFVYSQQAKQMLLDSAVALGEDYRNWLISVYGR